MLGRPKRCKLAHAFPCEDSYKRLELAQLLGQLTWQLSHFTALVLALALGPAAAPPLEPGHRAGDLRVVDQQQGGCPTKFAQGRPTSWAKFRALMGLSVKSLTQDVRFGPASGAQITNGQLKKHLIWKNSVILGTRVRYTDAIACER